MGPNLYGHRRCISGTWDLIYMATGGVLVVQWDLVYMATRGVFKVSIPFIAPIEARKMITKKEKSAIGLSVLKQTGDSSPRPPLSPSIRRKVRYYTHNGCK